MISAFLIPLMCKFMCINIFFDNARLLHEYKEQSDIKKFQSMIINH